MHSLVVTLLSQSLSYDNVIYAKNHYIVHMRQPQACIYKLSHNECAQNQGGRYLSRLDRERTVRNHSILPVTCLVAMVSARRAPSRSTRNGTLSRFPTFARTPANHLSPTSGYGFWHSSRSRYTPQIPSRPSISWCSIDGPVRSIPASHSAYRSGSSQAASSFLGYFAVMNGSVPQESYTEEAWRTRI